MRDLDDVERRARKQIDDPQRLERMRIAIARIRKRVEEKLLEVMRIEPSFDVTSREGVRVAKKLEEDQQTGSKRYVYIRLGEDHFRHAFNYCAISMHELSRGFFSGLDLL